MTLLLTNCYALLFYIVLSLGQRFIAISPWLVMTAAVLVVWILPAVNLAALLNHFLKRKLLLPEFLSVAVFAGLIILPSLLALEFLLLQRLWSWLPLANALVITVVVWFRRPHWPLLPRYSVSEFIQMALNSPLLWALVIHVAITTVLTRAFLALPDIDPYKWADWYNVWLQTGPSVAPTTRPLFYFFGYLFTPGSTIPLYPFFKYVFPYVGLLAILPAWLTVTRQWTRLTQLAWYLLPFVSPGLILYAALPIPQSLLILNTILFFHLILGAAAGAHASLYWLAGLTIFMAFFYHQAAALIFVVWLIVTLWWKRRALLSAAMRHKTIAVASLLAGVYLIQRVGLYGFIAHWFSNIAKRHFQTNWYFPSYYLSIDGQSVGWAGVAGVAKYYLFYVGPIVLALFLLTMIWLVRYREFRLEWWRLVTRCTPLTVLLVAGALFITISEVLPRLASIALLPERSWLFGGIFSGLLLWKMVTAARTQLVLATFFLFLIAVSMGGALYINNLKAHTIPDYQIRSAEWIKANLPSDRIMISNEQPYLLTTNAESSILPIDGTSLCNLDLADDQFLKEAWGKINPHIGRERQQILEVYMQRMHTLIATDPHITLADLEATSEHFITKLNENAQAQQDIPDFKHRLFIYHALPDASNILLNRPYVQANRETVCLTPVFDEHPELFTKIYDDQGLVRMWRYNTSPH